MYDEDKSDLHALDRVSELRFWPPIRAFVPSLGPSKSFQKQRPRTEFRPTGGPLPTVRRDRLSQSHRSTVLMCLESPLDSTNVSRSVTVGLSDSRPCK